MELHVYRTLPEKLKAVIAVADRCFFNKGEIVNEKLRVASSFLGLCARRNLAPCSSPIDCKTDARNKLGLVRLLFRALSCGIV